MKNFLIKTLRGTLRQLALWTLWRYKPTIVAVTGSVGKTSTKLAIAATLGRARRIRASRGNFNSELGTALTILGDWKETELSLVSRDQPAGTATARKIIFWLKVLFVSLWHVVARKKNYPEILVLEYGADKPGDIKYLVNFARPTVGAITAIGTVPVHVEFYAGPDDLAREKGRLIEALPAAGFAVLNADDETVLALKDRTRARVMTFGFANDADVRVSHMVNRTEAASADTASKTARRPIGISFKLEYGGAYAPVRLDGVFGKAHAYAAAAGAAIGLLFGMNLVTISEALADYAPAESRMHLIPGIKNTYVIDDAYNASPLSMHAALDTLRSLPGERKIAILGDMLEIGKYTIEAHEQMGDLASESADALFTVGARAKLMAAAAAQSGMKKENIFSFDTADDARIPVQNFLKQGDLVLVKGSHAMQLDKIVEEIRADATVDSQA
jgi:UDP-N-acetylmuramoyl-tripeptide--D-alanyl-D-alanine ligase